MEQVIVTLRFEARQQPILDPAAVDEPTAELGRTIPRYEELTGPVLRSLDESEG